MIMEKQLVPSDIAKKVFEKGFFNWETRDVNELIPFVYTRDVCPKPTIYKVLKWLREEKKIHIAIEYSPTSLWRYVITFCDERAIQEPAITQNNHLEYSHAIIEAIKYVLEKII